MILHFVHAGFELCMIGFGVMNYIFAKHVFLNSNFWKSPNGTSPNMEMMQHFMLPLYVVAAALALAAMVCSILCGFWIRRRTQWTLCQVAAGLCCLHMPLGTILGVFTILVLNRDSVRALFGSQSASNP